MPYRVETWHGSQILELVALSSWHTVAKAAFMQTCVDMPNDHVTLRMRMRLIEEREKPIGPQDGKAPPA
jgi:hypothetical protein